MIFVDLKKAYDSVPREALWAALKKLGIPDQLVTIIRSFHENMKVKIRELLDEIEVENGLLQGCTMTPTLFNLYTCVVAESLMSKVRDIDGVGTYVFYKLYQQPFRRYTRNTREDVLYKCEFADDVALQTQQLRQLVVGPGVQEEELLPMSINVGTIECVKEFLYLGLLIAASGRIDGEVDKRLANAS